MLVGAAVDAQWHQVGWELLGLEVSKESQAAMSEPVCSAFALLPAPCSHSAVLFISQAALFLRCCTIFPFPCFSSSPFFSGSSHLNFGIFVVFSPSPLHPWSISSAWVGGWQLWHTAGPGTGSSSAVSWIPLAQSGK